MHLSKLLCLHRRPADRYIGGRVAVWFAFGIVSLLL
jgi:hypothetical protein